jgi:alkanesulfonate monooxygenase SsuD/methylene tetrahydromethanopterin reductase-like flavin-dependent oxidoreductase (luciferase family)
MIEKAAEAGGSIALVGSIEEAVNGTARLIRERAKARGRSVDLSRRLLVDPKICTHPAGVRELEEKIRPLIQVCHAVVVVQASLSVVEDFFTGAEKEKILTSPRLAVARLKEILEGYPS